jgi:hypothetical protein
MPAASANQDRRIDIGSDLMMKPSKRIVCQARARLQDWTRRDGHKFGWHAIFYRTRSLMRQRAPVPFLARHSRDFRSALSKNGIELMHTIANDVFFGPL